MEVLPDPQLLPFSLLLLTYFLVVVAAKSCVEIESKMPHAFIQLVSRKEGLTLTEFKDRFENKFVPLMKQICGPLFPLTWVRRYIADDANEEQIKRGLMGLPVILIGRREEIGWDSLSEMTFRDELHFQQYFALINEKEPSEMLLAEEKEFSDINKLKFVVMESWTDKNEYITKKDT